MPDRRPIPKMAAMSQPKPEEKRIEATGEVEPKEETQTGGALVPVARPALPVPARPVRPRRRLLLALAAVALAAIGGGYWWLASRPGLPPGIVSGNGRLEADEIDIATKFAGRIARLQADEGDLVHAGDV